MIAYLRYVLLRTLFVLSVLAAGLVAIPGDVGAGESLLNWGGIEASGARRIKVEPSESSANGGGNALAATARRTLQSITRVFGGGAGPATPAAPIPVAEQEAKLASLAETGPLGSLRIVRGERDKGTERMASAAAMMKETDMAEGAKARAEREAAALARAHRPPTRGEALYAEFGAPAPRRSPFDIARAALSAAPD